MQPHARLPEWSGLQLHVQLEQFVASHCLLLMSSMSAYHQLSVLLVEIAILLYFLSKSPSILHRGEQSNSPTNSAFASMLVDIPIHVY
jgi:hypothetical protein